MVRLVVFFHLGARYGHDRRPAHMFTLALLAIVLGAAAGTLGTILAPVMPRAVLVRVTSSPARRPLRLSRMTLRAPLDVLAGTLGARGHVPRVNGARGSRRALGDAPAVVLEGTSTRGVGARSDGTRGVGRIGRTVTRSAGKSDRIGARIGLVEGCTTG